MDMEQELAEMEKFPQTEAELIDQKTETLDVESFIDEYLGPDAVVDDMIQAYSSFFTENEVNYGGYDPQRVISNEEEYELSEALYSEGMHIEYAPTLEGLVDETIDEFS